MENNLLQMIKILLAPPDIISRVEQIEVILKEIDDLPDNQGETVLEQAVFMIKDAIQREAEQNWVNNAAKGLLAMATGTGKSKVPINYLKDVVKQSAIVRDFMKVLLIVPTEKLRDENWKEEFQKWGAGDIYNVVQRTCYASLKNIEGQDFDLVIGDEFHNITEANSEFFFKNKITRLIALTATEPSNPVKQQLLKDLNLPTVYKLPLDIAVRLRLVSPYEITVVECRLDHTTKNIIAGSKDKPFMQTELKAYQYKNDLVRKAMFVPPRARGARIKFTTLDRMHFIKNLESKQKSAKFILEKIIPPDARTLIFAGSIEQAEALCSNSFHSKSTGTDKLELFKKGNISKLSVVDAVNEGHNIPDIDYLFIVQMNSSEKTATQRLGRGIRWRAGHICKVIILMVMDTVDEKWVEKATINLDKTNIKRVRFSNLEAGNNLL